MRAKLKDPAGTIRAARSTLIDFTRFTFPAYRTHWHHRLVASELDRLLFGDIKRLMIFMPPQHGKSELVSRRLPAFALGRNPDEKIIACSYGHNLASDMNRDVQKIMASPDYQDVFPETALWTTANSGSARGLYKRTAKLFEVVGHRGYYLSAGIDGGITGKGFTLGIIDDPIKGRAQANSATYREKVWAWWLNDFDSRQTQLTTDARILLTTTRWHRDDLAGRLLRQSVEKGGEKWTVITLPALRPSTATHSGDPRQEGEALWPLQKDRASLEARRRRGRNSFAAIFQQDPSETGNTAWPASHFGPHIWAEPSTWPDAFEHSVIAFDPAMCKREKSDYSAFVFVGFARGLYWVDAEIERREVDPSIRAILAMAARYDTGEGVGVVIEANGFQDLVIGEYVRIAGPRIARYPGYAVTNHKDKHVRIRRLGPALAANLVRFRSDSSGCRLLVDQLQDFPNADHDDGPDAMEMALIRGHNMPGALRFDEDLAEVEG